MAQHRNLRKRNFYCDDRLYAVLKRKAAATHRSLSAYMVMACIVKDIHTIPALNVKLHAELGRVGGNLNQITKELNRAFDLHQIANRDYERVMDAVIEARDALRLCRQSLIGVQP